MARAGKGRGAMRLKRLSCGLIALVGAALAGAVALAAEFTTDIDRLETDGAAHVAAYTALDTKRANLSLQYHGLVEQLTQRLTFGTVPKNSALQQDLAKAQAALTALGETAPPLTESIELLTDDASRINALSRALRSALAGPDTDKAALQPLANRAATASDTVYRTLAQALEQKQRQTETMKDEPQTLATLAQAIDTGKLPSADDPTIAEMLAPPRLMDAQGSASPPPAAAPPRAPADNGHWAIEFGMFPTEDDAAFIMAKLSLRGTQSRFLATKDRQGHAGFRVVTSGYASKAAAESAAAEFTKHDLPPSRVIEMPPS
jgi:cell division protein FtsN